METPSNSAPVVMVFLKAPRRGEVKTRLAATVGADEATDIYRIMAESQLRRIPAEFITEVHFAPIGSEAEMRVWLGNGPQYFPQSSGDLGARLAHAFHQRLSREESPVFAIGADCPTLNEETLRQAAAALMMFDVVLGPAKDGGYYLIGMRRPLPQLFADIPWSSACVLKATVERAKSAGLTWHLLPVMEDIDDEESLRRYIASALNARSASKPALIHV